MLNVSWGQQDHTLHTDKDYNSNLCCLLSALVVVVLVALVIVVSVLIQWALFCFCKCSTVTACVCHISHFTFIQFQFQLALQLHFASLRCVFYFTRAPKSMQHTMSQATWSLACLCTCRFQHTARRFSWDWQCVAFVPVRIGSFGKFTHTRVAQPNAQHDSCCGESSLPKLSWISNALVVLVILFELFSLSYSALPYALSFLLQVKRLWVRIPLGIELLSCWAELLLLGSVCSWAALWHNCFWVA